MQLAFQDMKTPKVQYITDNAGNVTGVIVPIDTWKDLLSERETEHLLRSEPMRQRLLESMERTEGVPFNDAIQKLGLG